VLGSTRDLERCYQMVLQKCVGRERRVIFFWFLDVFEIPIFAYVASGCIHIIGMDGVLGVETEICGTIKVLVLFISYKLLRGVDVLSAIGLSIYGYRYLVSIAKM